VIIRQACLGSGIRHSIRDDAADTSDRGVSLDFSLDSPVLLAGFADSPKARRRTRSEGRHGRWIEIQRLPARGDRSRDSFVRFVPGVLFTKCSD